MFGLFLVAALEEPCAPFVWREDPKPLLVTAPRDQTDRFFGLRSCGIGDVDGDGKSDVLVFTQSVDGDSKTTALVFSGRDGTRLSDVDLLADLPMAFVRELWIGSPARLSDLDGDCSDDWGVQRNDWHWRVEGWFTAYSSVRRTPLWSIQGALDSPRFARSAESVLDENGDGVRDVLVNGAPMDAMDSKDVLATILSGRDGRTLRTIAVPPSVRDVLTVFCSAADSDADGRTDLALGQREKGSDSRRIRLLESSTFPAMREIAIVDIRGPDVIELRNLGDLDEDGANELGLNLAGFGALIVSTCNGSILFGELSHPGEELADFGSELAAFRDATGRATVLISAEGEEMFGGAVHTRSLSGLRPGRVRATSKTLDIWHFGSRLEVVGDVDSDGVPDFVSCVDHSQNANPGMIQMCSGLDGHMLWRAESSPTGIQVSR